MGIGGVGNFPNVMQAGMSEGEKQVNSSDAGKIKTLYGDAAKVGMLSAHMSRMDGFYASVKAMIDIKKNDIDGNG